MAHSDTLIFLSSITWILFLFIFVYFFFVLFFLPTFYKKFRMRAIVKNKNYKRSVLAIRGVLATAIFAADFLKLNSLIVLGSLKVYLRYFRGNYIVLAQINYRALQPAANRTKCLYFNSFSKNGGFAVIEFIKTL